MKYPSWEEWKESFEIFLKYRQEGRRIVATKGEIIAGPDPKSMSDEDRNRLLEIGWKERSIGNFGFFAIYTP